MPNCESLVALTLVVVVVAQELVSGSARLCLLFAGKLVIVASILMFLPAKQTPGSVAPRDWPSTTCRSPSFTTVAP